MIPQAHDILRHFRRLYSNCFRIDRTANSVQHGVGSDYAAWDSTGHQTFAGNARPWRDALTDSLLLKQAGTGVSTNATESTVDFITGANLSDWVYCNIQLNHDRDHTSPIYPHIHWLQAQNNVPNFLLEYRWQVLGGAKTTAWTQIKCNTAAFTYTSGTLHQICYAGAVNPPVGTTISDIVQWRIYRDNANTSTKFAGADPYTTTVGILAFDLHLQINSLGSTDEYAK